MSQGALSWIIALDFWSSVKLDINSTAKSSRRSKIRSPCLSPFNTSAGLAPRKKGVTDMTLSPQQLICRET